MSTPVKEHHCALCGSANVARGRKYCPECLSAVRKTQAEEHNKKLKAQYEEKKKAGPAARQQPPRCLYPSRCCRTQLRPAGRV